MISSSGTPMLPRHLQNVGSRYIARAGHSRSPSMNRSCPRCPWCPTNYPQTLYQPGSAWNPQQHLRPYSHHQRSALLPTPRLPWAPGPSSWLHMSHYNMQSAGDEHIRKRKKGMEADDRGKKVGPLRTYPPANDFIVPPAQGTPGTSASPHTEPRAASILKRRWEDFSHLYCQPSRGKFDFSVISYNILSQDLLEDNSSLYQHCRRPFLFWNYRLPNILNELKEMNADILCLQEVQEDHYQEQIKPSLEALGYLCEYKARTGTKPDGCAICFKSDKFNLMLVKPVEYYRRNIALLDRDNIGLLLLLQPKRERKAPVFCVANTHLLYNPRRGDIKLTQLAILLAEITEVAQMKDGKFCPIILCGDFNSVPGSPLLKFIKEGRLDYEGMTIGKVSGQERYPKGQRILSIPIWPKSLGITRKCVYEPQKDKEEKEDEAEAIQESDKQKEESSIREESNLQHHFSLSSVYSHVFPDSGASEITTCHSKSAITVDYIFYTAATGDISAQPGSQVPYTGLQLLGRLSLLTEKDLWSVNGLPNESSSSDHLSLLARFRLAL